MNIGESKELQKRRALTDAQRNAKKKVGDQLGNGAIIIDQSDVIERTEEAHVYVVLAMVPDTFQPYVTWKRVVGIEQKADGNYGPGVDYCWAGGYHRNIVNAVADYQQRKGEEV